LGVRIRETAAVSDANKMQVRASLRLFRGLRMSTSWLRPKGELSGRT
jgi:hypothetical protein